MNKSVALVLSSGGARGVAHIGIIEGLLEEGYEISSISGSSMGAVVGGVYAAGKLPEFKKWISNLDKIDVFKLMDFTFSSQGFVRGDKVFNEMKKFVSDCNIEELNIPLSIIATDITNNKEVVFQSGKLFTALRASAAIPSVLKPSYINGIEHVDGGVCNPIPIAHVLRIKNDILVVSDVNANVISTMTQPEPKQLSKFSELIEKWNGFFPGEQKTKRLSYFDLIANSIDMMQDQISDHILERNKPDIVVRISRNTSGTFEFYRSSALIEHGKQEIKRAIKDASQRA
jgi:NTE family protein